MKPRYSIYFLLLRRQPSVASTESSFVGGEGGSTEKINEFQAAWNVTNAIQGMFIVSLPFAVLRGGYWAIIAMVGIAYICCYTGKVKKYVSVECVPDIIASNALFQIKLKSCHIHTSPVKSFWAFKLLSCLVQELNSHSKISFKTNFLTKDFEFLDFSAMFVWARSKYRWVGSCAWQLCVDCKSLLWTKSRCETR